MDPLVFEPFFRPMVWGGRRLEKYLGARLPAEGTFGEAWMLSAQSLHVSRVAEGPLQETLLSELWAKRGEELAGHRVDSRSPFPLLIKVLDCQDLLSIQVHPNDEIAARLRPGELGKTEAWVILQADPGSRIYAGLRQGVTRAQLERHLDAGTVAECLHSFVPQPGQCVFLPAGLVHAVGGGVLMAEVQQSSDITFRLFDWNRLGTDGKPRALHRDEALQSINWSAGPLQPTTGDPIANVPAGSRGERLVGCPYFTIDRFGLGSPLDMPYARQLSIWMVLEGAAELAGPAAGYSRRFRPGETALVPATAGPLRWTPEGDGKVTLLGVLVPTSVTGG
jgi:mannose-6-phosphate isomerase